MNVVNSRLHSALDIATLLWLTQERRTGVSRRTNNLESVHEGKVRIGLKSLPSASALSSLVHKSRSKFHTRLDSTSSCDDGCEENDSSSSSSENDTASERAESLFEESYEDCRMLTTTMQPIKYAEVGGEVMHEDGDSHHHRDHSSHGNPCCHTTCISSVLELLYSAHAQCGKAVEQKLQMNLRHLPQSESEDFQSNTAANVGNPFLLSSDFGKSVRCKDFMEGRTVFSLYEELEYNINQCLDSQSSLCVSPDQAIALAMQQRELVQFRKTTKPGIGFEVNGGSRLLFLDGGGIKGLVQLEVLRLLEEGTGKKITQLFDWIIGSSIGAIIALGLVYGKGV